MKNTPQINTGSMADIAFLLLVFFLVTTTINQDFGITTNISKPFQLPDSVKLATSTLCINNESTYMLNGNTIPKKSISIELAESFSIEKSAKNVIIVKSERDVNYTDFLKALDESKKSIKLFYNILAQEYYGSNYTELAEQDKKQIVIDHPVVLAEDIKDF
jgi:biopolymer transport protein ExbD